MRRSAAQVQEGESRRSLVVRSSRSNDGANALPARRRLESIPGSYSGEPKSFACPGIGSIAGASSSNAASPSERGSPHRTFHRFEARFRTDSASHNCRRFRPRSISSSLSDLALGSPGRLSPLQETGPFAPGGRHGTLGRSGFLANVATSRSFPRVQRRMLRVSILPDRPFAPGAEQFRGPLLAEIDPISEAAPWAIPNECLHDGPFSGALRIVALSLIREASAL